MNIEQLKEKVEETKRTLKEHGLLAVKNALAKLFEELPELVCVRWVQYTDYFNDGEECRFRVGEPTFLYESTVTELGLNRNYVEKKLKEGENVEEIGWYIIYEEGSSNVEIEDKYWAQIANLGNNTLKEIFGDHKEILIFKDEALIFDYTDHN